MEQTSARDQHVLHLVALLDRPVNPALLMPLLRAPAPGPGDAVAEDLAVVVASLDRLVDLQLLASTPDGYVVRDPFLRHAVESWLRPSVRRRLHAHIAERARIPAAERGRHWRAAGEVELATAAAFDAVRDAMAAGDVSDARRQLLVVNDLARRLARSERRPGRARGVAGRRVPGRRSGRRGGAALRSRGRLARGLRRDRRTAPARQGCTCPTCTGSGSSRRPTRACLGARARRAARARRRGT